VLVHQQAPAIGILSRAADPAAAALACVRRRARSPASRISPLTIRKMLAAIGFAKIVRKVCSNASPVRPTGIVAIRISHANRSSDPRALNLRSRKLRRALRVNPPMMRIQSARKNHSSANAVLKCRATMNAR
jgi:hypothetical protein